MSLIGAGSSEASDRTAAGRESDDGCGQISGLVGDGVIEALLRRFSTLRLYRSRVCNDVASWIPVNKLGDLLAGRS